MGNDYNTYRWRISMQSWAATRASYIFWDNHKVKPEDIILAHKKSTVERIQSQIVQNDIVMSCFN